jgi:MoxR-like ATPase
MATPAPAPSCLTCPSFLAPSDAAAATGKSIDAPMCARFGYVLGRAGATDRQNRETAELRAKTCSHHGEAKPTRGWAVSSLLPTEVFLPDPEARTELSELDSRRTAVRSCAQCTNYVSEEAVQEKTGFAAGACAAKGKLILGNKKVAEATSCQYRQSGARRTELALPLLPIYSTVSMAEAATLRKISTGPVEPLEWVSDKRVTLDEEAQGIKAWRAIHDPEGTGNVVYLPVFQPDTFTKEQQQLIPKTGDEEHPELYVDYGGYTYQIAVLWMELDETPAAWGMPGVGKTEVGRHLAWMMQIPFYRFSIKESTELYELEGSTQYSAETGTFFKEGRFTKAWASICVIVVDEPNMGRPEVWAFLRPCMDNSKQLVIDADGGRNVKRNTFCFPMLAMNPAWSPLNVGTNPIGAADARRLMHIDFSLPEESVEREIIKNRVRLDGWLIDDVRLGMVMQVSKQIRELCDSSVLAMSWGVSDTIKVSRAMRHFDPITAFRIAGANYLEPQQRDTLLEED